MMATKRTSNRNNKSKSNVSKSAQLTQFKFRWWMAVIGVGIIALVGIVILRFSHASGPTYTDFVSNITCDNSSVPLMVAGESMRGSCRIQLGSSGQWFVWQNGGASLRQNWGSITCANISSQGWLNEKLAYVSNGQAYARIKVGDPVTVAETGNFPQNGVCPKSGRLK